MGKQKHTVIRTWPSSKAGRLYELRQGGDGKVYCTCMAWRFSKESPKTCKHMIEWAETIARKGAHLAEAF